MRIDQSGRLGIGTSTPAGQFAVFTNSDVNNTYLRGSSNTNYALTVENGGGTGLGLNLRVGNTDSDATILSANNQTGTNFFTVTDGNSYFQNGNVGIGTTTPNGRLVVKGSGTGTGTTTQFVNSSEVSLFSLLDNGTFTFKGISGTATSSIGGAINIGSNAFSSADFLDVVPSYVANITTSSASSDTLMLVNSGVSSPGAGINFHAGLVGVDGRSLNAGHIVSGHASVASPGGYANSFITLGTASAASTYRDELTLRGGNVGIGTTTPSYKLDVDVGSAGSGIAVSNSGAVRAILGKFSGGDGYLSLYDDEGNENARVNSDSFTFFNGGNVGIGTTTPTAQLHSWDDATSQVFTENADNLLVQSSRNSDWLVAIESQRNNSATQKLLRLVSDTSAASSNNFEIANSTGTYFVARNDGNIGIGTTSPMASLSIYGGNATRGAINMGGTGSYNAVWLNGSATFNDYNILSSAADKALFINRPAGENIFFRENNVTQMAITAGGTIGIGTSTSNTSLSVYSSAAGGALTGDITISSFNPGLQFVDRTTSADDFRMFADGNNLHISADTDDDGTYDDTSEFLTLTSGGNVGIGTSSPSAQLTTTGTVRFANFGAGTLQTDANGNLSVSSDERVKDVRGEFTKGLEAVLALQPIDFTWKSSSGFDTANVYTGFSAQNVRDAIPEAVGEDKHGFLTLSDRPILAAVVNAVKEIHEETVSLQATVTEFAVEFFSNRLRTNELCIGTTCITESELEQMLEERGIEEAEPSGDGASDDTLEPDDEIEAPSSEDDADAAPENVGPLSDPSAESSSNSEEVTVADAAPPPVEEPAVEPDPPAEPPDEAPSPGSMESPSPDQAAETSAPAQAD
ncbi:MAG: hypothetical protein GEV13_33615 [Rhodospirillales bacterium]|nr:hypothetical protein [Rhodospirillales bacterium]